MSDQLEDILDKSNPFIEALFAEFEQTLQRVFGFDYNHLINILDEPQASGLTGETETNFMNAFEQGGMPQLRWEMRNTIVCLEYVFLRRLLKRDPSFEEWAESVEEMQMGFTREDLVVY